MDINYTSLRQNISQNYFTKSNTKISQEYKTSPSKAKTLNLNFSPLALNNKSSINFCAMKKSQFLGVDLMLVNQLKAPIEKMNTNDDFQNYCQKILDEKYLGVENIKKLSKSIDPQAQIQKEAILKEWIKYVVDENDAYTPAIELMILSSITQNLDENSNHLPPTLDKRKVADTIEEISENCKTNKQYQCNFDKLYRNKLQKSHLETETQLDENLSGWVIIPSKEHDPQNFEKNVEKLKALSHHNWCTKTFNAKPYLAQGDFHVYLEKGKQKLGVRFDGDVIQEIQGEKNNSQIPVSYLDIAKKHVEEGKYNINQGTKSEFDEAEKIKAEFEKIKKDLAEPIKQKDYQKILEYFDVEVEKDENGLMTLSELREPNVCAGISFFKDIGVDINDLLKHVKEVTGCIDLSDDTTLISTGALEKVGGSAYLNDCTNLKEIPNLKKVGRNLLLNGAESLTSTGALEEVGGKANFSNCPNLKEIPNLKKVGMDLCLANATSLTSTGALEEVGGNADFRDCTNLKDIPNLKKIGSDLYLWSVESLTSTGALEEVGGNADFRDCTNLKDIPNLKKVGRNLYLKNAKSLTSTGALEEVGRSAYLNDCTNLKEFPHIKYIG